MYKQILIAICIVGQTACSSTHSNLVSGSNLGAQEYKPAVFVPPENQAKYDQALEICRRVAVNRQLTAADEAQLGVITESIEGAGTGLATGIEFSSLMDDIGLDSDIGKSAGIGAVVGLTTSLVSSLAQGTQDTAYKTRQVLLNCLRKTSNNGSLWNVLE